jgi:hypothetical protein
MNVSWSNHAHNLRPTTNNTEPTWTDASIFYLYADICTENAWHGNKFEMKIWGNNYRLVLGQERKIKKQSEPFLFTFTSTQTYVHRTHDMEINSKLNMTK